MNHQEPPAGTDNVLYELGFEDAEGLSQKTKLAVKLNAIIDKRGLHQVDVVRITGLNQRRLSLTRRYKLQDIPPDLLLQALVALESR